ncbi:MAG: alpha-glucosidase/alpha-galactosidase [bacterium]
MPKITIIGAGSLVFSRQLLWDILSFPELSESTISLMDIDEKRLTFITHLAEKMAKSRETKAKIEATSDRGKALKDADYVIVTLEVGGLDAYLNDLRIPDRYGINQNVGDTIGPGGVFRALRTVPVMVEICKDMEKLCPDAYLLNYTNPMAINCWAMNRISDIKKVGLCHSVQGTAQQLASYMQIPYEELSYWVAGINHMAWFLELKWKGEDAYPILRRVAKDKNLWDRVIGGYRKFGMKDIVRFKIMEHFGYFVTESPYHMSEYVPYFRKDEKQMEGLGILYRWWLDYKKAPDPYIKEIRDQIAGKEKIAVEKSDEYAPQIIYSLHTGKPCRINGNVENKGLITNLLEGSCVEVPCLVDKSGIHPCYIGNLPSQCAALNRTNINVQDLAVQAALTGDKDALLQAVTFDPLTSSILTLDEIKKMVNEMLEAEARHLPGF